jgi:hypothetical protein
LYSQQLAFSFDEINLDRNTRVKSTNDDDIKKDIKKYQRIISILEGGNVAEYKSLVGKESYITDIMEKVGFNETLKSLTEEKIATESMSGVPVTNESLLLLETFPQPGKCVVHVLQKPKQKPPSRVSVKFAKRLPRVPVKTPPMYTSIKTLDSEKQRSKNIRSKIIDKRRNENKNRPVNLEEVADLFSGFNVKPDDAEELTGLFRKVNIKNPDSGNRKSRRKSPRKSRRKSPRKSRRKSPKSRRKSRRKSPKSRRKSHRKSPKSRRKSPKSRR